jgi:hypothetical protein
MITDATLNQIHRDLLELTKHQHSRVQWCQEPVTALWAPGVRKVCSLRADVIVGDKHLCAAHGKAAIDAIEEVNASMIGCVE